MGELDFARFIYFINCGVLVLAKHAAAVMACMCVVLPPFPGGRFIGCFGCPVLSRFISYPCLKLTNNSCTLNFILAIVNYEFLIVA